MPPIHYLTGAGPVDWSDGSCVVAGPASPWLAAPHGNVAGGAICLLADSAIAGAIQTTVRAGQGYAMVDLKINFLRPVVTDFGEITARGQVLTRGRTTSLATSEVTDSSGKMVAVSSGSARMLDRPFLGESGVRRERRP